MITGKSKLPKVSQSILHILSVLSSEVNGGVYVDGYIADVDVAGCELASCELVSCELIS